MPSKTIHRKIRAEAVQFTLEGALTHQTFPCRQSMAATTLMKFAEEMGGEEDTAKAGMKALPALRGFLSAAIEKHSVERFWQMLDDPEQEIDLEQLMEIVEFLTEMYSGERPTGEDSSATSATSSSGAGSTGTQSPVATPTYSR